MAADIKVQVSDSDDSDAADPEISNRTPLLDKSCEGTETKTKVLKVDLSRPSSLEAPQFSVSNGTDEEIKCLDARLHKAVRLQDLDGLRSLLGAGAAETAQDEAGRTPYKQAQGSVGILNSVLLATILAEWTEGVEAALNAGADLTAICKTFVMRSPQEELYNLSGQTALHLAATSRNMEMLDVTLGYAKRKGVLNCRNTEGATPLYTAIKMNNLIGVKAFIEKGASVEGISKENESALHVAVQSPTILKYILENADVRISTDNNKDSPIHKAVYHKSLKSLELLLDHKDFGINFGSQKTAEGKSLLHLAVESECYEIIKYLISYAEFQCGDGRHIVDKNEETPLFLALREKGKELVEFLLKEAHVLSAKRKDGKTAIEIIANEFNDAPDILSNVLDHFIKIKPDRYEFNYTFFTDNKDISQLSVIEKFIQYDHSDLLLHPLIQSFVYIKWCCFVPVFYAMIAVHATLLISFNILVANIFYHRDMANRNDTEYENAGSERRFQLYDGWFWFLVVLIYTIITILIVQVSVFVYARRLKYFAEFETWMRLCFLVLASFMPVVLACAEPANWQRHVTCLALLLGWLQVMFLLSRFPSWGSHVLMFGRVVLNLIKILVSMLFLIIGFSLCFMIQYRSRPPFDGPYAAFVKTLIMMSSDLNYDELFGEQHGNELRDSIVIIRVLFVLFVVFVVIALMNFMTGAAVSDINELNVIAKVRRLEKQVKLLSALETLVCEVAKYFKNVFRRGRYYAIMTFPITKMSKWKVECPKWNIEEWSGNSSDTSFEVHPCPKLHKNIVKLVKEKKRSEAKQATDNKIKMLLNTVIDGPTVGGDVNTAWVIQMLSKQNEQIQLLKDNLKKVSLLSNQVKYSNEFYKKGHQTWCPIKQLRRKH